MTITTEVQILEQRRSLDEPEVYTAREIARLVRSASKVVAPLWPISTFAARSPWMGLQGQKFHQVAEQMNASRGIDMYPGTSLLVAAQKNNEIDEGLLDRRLSFWLDSNPSAVPREAAQVFCRAALKLDEMPKSLLHDPQIQRAAKQLRGHAAHFPEPSPCLPVSLRLETNSAPPVARELNHHMIKWCKLYLDEFQAAWKLPYREDGFYESWRKLIPLDPALSRRQRRALKSWPDTAEQALSTALIKLGIPHANTEDYLREHLLCLPGWVGMMRWMSEQSTPQEQLLVDYLAIRLSLEWVLVQPYLPLQERKPDAYPHLSQLIAAWVHWGAMPVAAWSSLTPREQIARLSLAKQFDALTRRRLWLEAWEETHAKRLHKSIQSPAQVLKKGSPEKPTAQFAFCIDVRSEPFRRHLEQAGPFETYGTAGFFGLPVAIRELGRDSAHPSLPVILKPQHFVQELGSSASASSYLRREARLASLATTFKTLKQSLLGSLLLPEVTGPILGMLLAARTLFPRLTGVALRRLRNGWLRKPSTELSLERQDGSFEHQLPIGFTDEEMVHYARQGLVTMGLTKSFAPLVVICGHGSQSTNNPYAAKLDCGACGGASGALNAKILASISNMPGVRNALAADGIDIPPDTVFVAAEHATTVDELRWVYVPHLSHTAEAAFRDVNRRLPKVQEGVITDRVPHLPSFEVQSAELSIEAQRLAEDWSELRPEWGLARNASFIIGRRELTQNSNLEGRAFLHSYDWRSDSDGALLANIIAGPGTVAQWINLQYYASTVDPDYYGSGNKVTQTVTAGLGVMNGNASDLLTGLPWQSVMRSDDELYHLPLRLLIVIEAPKQNIVRLLEGNASFRESVEHGWVRLASIDPDGGWKSWS